MQLGIQYPRLTKKLRINDFRKWVHEQVSISWKAGAKAFFEETATKIAIDSGMSVASLIPLATKVRAANLIRAELARRPHDPSKGYTTLQGIFVPDGYRSIIQGIRESKAAGTQTQDITFGSPSAPDYTFIFEIAIYQWSFWEGKRFHALEAGKEAFKKEFEKQLAIRVNQVNISNWLLTGELLAYGDSNA